MNEKKLIIVLIVGTLMLLGGSVMVLSSSSVKQEIKLTQNAKAQVSENKFNWGDINFDGPKATKIFQIKNNGTEILKLTNLKTSCTCTSAQIDIDGNKSPLISMHTASSWVGEVAPGKTAELTVVFDQAFHGPSGVGPVERLISVETNEAGHQKLEFTLTGNVVKL